VFFATDLYAPKLESTKTVSPSGTAKAGDRLTYTMSVKNTGLDAATNVVLTDRLPAGTTFVPGSLVSSVPGQNEYDSANRQVVFRLGRLAPQAADWQATVSFAVTVNDGLPQGTQLTNVGTIGYTAETLNTPGEVDTPILDRRPLPPDAKARSTMMMAEDVAAAILLCATLPPRAVVEEIVMTATHQRDVSQDLEVARRLGEPGYTPPR